MPGGTETAPGWQRRITHTDEVSVDSILFNSDNWRIHPRHQQESLLSVLDEVGWVRNVLINDRTGAMIDGHLRVQLAERRGEATVPADHIDASPEEERLILASLDALTALAVRDQAKYDEVFQAVLDSSDRYGAILDQIRAPRPDAFLDDYLDSRRQHLPGHGTDNSPGSALGASDGNGGPRSGLSADGAADAGEYVSMSWMVSPADRQTILDTLTKARAAYLCGTLAEALVSVCEHWKGPEA